MSEDRRRILDMLAEGKINAEEAGKLLDAIAGQQDHTEQNDETPDNKSGKKLKYLRVLVEPKNGSGDKVNIKVPLQIIRAGVKFKSLLPGAAKDKVKVALEDKGINFNIDDLDSNSLENIFQALSGTVIDVEDGKETVKVFCE